MSEEARQGGEEPPVEEVQPHSLPGATEQPCANHPGRLTMVTCSDCGKPLCPDCMVFSAVGIKCKDCARLPRSARVMLKPERFAAAMGAGLATAIAIGFAYYFILGSLRFAFGLILIFVASGIGYLVGEAVSRASGRYHGMRTAILAAACTLVGFFLPPLLFALISYGTTWHTVIFALGARGIINWVVMLVAAFLAFNRNR